MMPTRSASPFQSTSGPLRRICDAIGRSLKTALTVLCRRRHYTDAIVTRLDRGTVDEPVRLRLKCNGQIQMEAHLRVTHVGGNVYDVDCTVEEGPSRRFTYSLPGRGGTVLSRTPDLGRKLGAFLLNELERQIGRQHLRSL